MWSNKSTGDMKKNDRNLLEELKSKTSEPNLEESDEEKENELKNKSHYGTYIILSISFLIVVLFLVGLLPRLYREKSLAQEAMIISKPKVTILEVNGNDKPVELILPSSLDAINITPLWARVDGYIKAFMADIGDSVKGGQILAEIETPELDHQFEHSIADLSKARARRDIAKVTADRWRELYEEDPEAIAKQEVDQRLAELEAAEAELTAAEATKRRIEKTLDFKRIIAPFDGIIIERNIDIGSLITAGSANHPQQLFKIAKTDVMRVFVNVPQRFFRSIKEQEPAEISINEFPEKIFKGFVARFAKALDPIARTLLTEVHILNPDEQLYVGLYADVKFLLKADNVCFVIPTSALIIRADGPKVAILDEKNKVRIRPVTLGLDHGKMMEITSGLSQHDKVITNPSEKIVEGMEVDVIASK